MRNGHGLCDPSGPRAALRLELMRVPEDLAKKVILYGDNLGKIKVADWAVVAKNRGAWIEQWNREMAR